MVKLAPFFLLFSALPVASFADYDGNSRTIPLEAFKDRFTIGELIGISNAYAEDATIRNAVSKLSSMKIVDLDSDVIKNDVAYLKLKSILSENRAKAILK